MTRAYEALQVLLSQSRRAAGEGDVEGAIGIAATGKH
jgi:hypothetical protein